MNVDFGWQAVARRFEHARPEQRVEIRDVFADEVMNFNLVVFPPVVQILAVLFAPLERRSDVADGRVEPDVPKVCGTVGNLKPKIGCRARDVPIAQLFGTFFTVGITEEVAFEVVCNFGLEVLARLRPLCLLYTSPSPRDQRGSRMPSSA